MRRVKLNIHKKDYGPSLRLKHQEDELEGANLVPNPVEYSDIDRAFIGFSNKIIDMVNEDGDKVPTFTLFSNQRFSEYSQTWQYTDDDGNLLMNFKTITRENNPKSGNIQGGNYNIPGNNRFTVLMKEVKDKNGIDCYEITSMSQPVQVDILYTLSFITSKYEMINEFNTKINSAFASLQHYLNVNGHNMPMTLEDIGDSSNYSIEERKFFVQSVTIKLLGYLIPKDDIKIELKPKKRKLDYGFENSLKKTYVSMEYVDDMDEFEFNLDFMDGVSKVKFELDEDIELTDIKEVET